MEIPEILINQIKQGEVVLLLGAGASISAKDVKGNHPPIGRKLGEMLSDRFLSGAYKELPLNQISEYAISMNNLFIVQDYIREIFEAYEPIETHKILCTFRWAGLATTNYDRIIERAYELEGRRIQKIAPYIKNGQRVDTLLRDPMNLLFLKLHGCITNTDDDNCPLILTTDQYIEYRRGRNRIFEKLQDWAYEKTIIFMGHSLQDLDIRAILNELTALGDGRPRYYLIKPDADNVQEQFWGQKRVTLLKGTFDDFVYTIDSKISSTLRGMRLLSQGFSHPIESRFVKPTTLLSDNAKQFLINDVDYVGDVQTQYVAPEEFYKGFSRGWSAIEQNLDVRRKLGDDIISERILINDSNHLGRMEFILIKSHAGAGKSTLLKRIAWDAAKDYNKLCLYVKDSGLINSQAIQEIINACNERVYLFVDRPSQRIREINSLYSNIGPEGKLLTLVCADRINEWNINGFTINSLVTDTYELKYLNQKEIENLVGMLDKHNSLGKLKSLSFKDRCIAFEQRAGRQLLVALYEATMSEPFENIIVDEFNNINNHEAQQIYLSICVLNRLDVKVRAGVIARLHGISFDQFKEKLFFPLEKIVKTEYDKLLRDYLYSARHPEIAEIVFQRILSNQEKRYDEYVKCLKKLNIDYQVDRQAFRGLTRARSVLELFTNNELSAGIYREAQKHVGKDPELLHQISIYEMKRPAGNMEEAERILLEAEKLASKNTAIKHTLSELFVTKSEYARTELERNRLLDEAEKICRKLKSLAPDQSHAYHTLIKINLIRLEEMLNKANMANSEMENAIKNIEEDISAGLQEFPGDSFILSAEASYASKVLDSKRALECLNIAFENNPRNSYVSMRLAKTYKKMGDKEKYASVLKRAIDANRNDKRLNFLYALQLIEEKSDNGQEIVYYLIRSFSPGDRNYEAQLLYGSRR